jgi:hypothetical protein
VTAGDSASISKATEILGRIKTECSEVTNTSGALTVQPSAVGLRAILDQQDVSPAESLKPLANRRYIVHKSVKVGNNNRFCPRCNCLLQRIRVDLTGDRINIGVDWDGTQGVARRCAVSPRVSNRYNFIFALHTTRPKRQFKRVGPVRYTYTSWYATVLSKRKLERFKERPAYVMALRNEVAAITQDIVRGAAMTAS